MAPSRDGRNVQTGPSALLQLAGAGLAAADPDTLPIDPAALGATEPAVEAARLLAPAGLAVMGVIAPARPVPAQGASTAASLDASALPAVEQVTQALVSPGLPQRITLHLAPTELGSVQIGIDRAADGPAKVSLLAERPETLLLLMRAQPALHRALDAAGLPTEGRMLSFGLAQPGAASAAATSTLPTPGSSGPSSMATGRDGSAPGGSQGGSFGGSSQGGEQGAGGYQPSIAEAGSGRPPARTPHRTGVDITA